ncbi:MAG: hypothetical protein S0880_24055, partial [Actinomycetota bacterium]|nr:hypothetical protein [Actinomycetota bacterium]
QEARPVEPTPPATGTRPRTSAPTPRVTDVARPRGGAMEPTYAGVATMGADAGDDRPENTRKRALQRLIESIRGA